MNTPAPAWSRLTTPNAEYNVIYETLPEGKMRHSDDRFEWTRAEFESWANGVASRRGYTAAFSPIGARRRRRRRAIADGGVYANAASRYGLI